MDVHLEVLEELMQLYGILVQVLQIATHAQQSSQAALHRLLTRGRDAKPIEELSKCNELLPCCSAVHFDLYL